LRIWNWKSVLEPTVPFTSYLHRVNTPSISSNDKRDDIVRLGIMMACNPRYLFFRLSDLLDVSSCNLEWLVVNNYHFISLTTDNRETFILCTHYISQPPLWLIQLDWFIVKLNQVKHVFILNLKQVKHVERVPMTNK
jgi:hypothetical protein